jgi:hypothetical protein
MGKVSLSIPTDQKGKLQEIADTLGVSVSALLRDWVGKILDSMEEK